MTGMLGVNLQIFDYYNVIENFVFVESKPVIQNAYTYEENGVLYCASATEKGGHCYTYALNNPLRYVDRTGEWYDEYDDDNYSAPHEIDPVECNGSRPDHDPFGNFRGIDEGIFDELLPDDCGGDPRKPMTFQQLSDHLQKMGYQVVVVPKNGTNTSTSNSTNQGTGDIFSGISEWSGFIPVGLDALGGLGTGMKQTGGTFAFKNGGVKHYAKSLTTGRMFYGNQYVNVHQMTQWGRGIGYGATGVSVFLGGVDILQGTVADGNTFGVNTKQAIGRTTGGLSGAWIGATIGAEIGVWYFGVGAIPGAIIGGIVGGFAGGWTGSKAGEELILYVDF